MYNNYGISEKVVEFSKLAMEKIKPQFEHIEKIAEYNQMKVLSAFNKHKISEAHFMGTSGYGYNDLGRDAIEEVYADVVAPMITRAEWEEVQI